MKAGSRLSEARFDGAKQVKVDSLTNANLLTANNFVWLWGEFRAGGSSGS